jgi:bilin biosynthesis protein
MVNRGPESLDLPSAAALRQQLTHRETSQRQLALAQLIEHPREELLADLAKRLDDGDPDVELLAVIALMQLGAVASPDFARGLAPHRPLAVRQMAASGLVQTSPTGEFAFGGLRRCLDDKDPTLHELASLALSRGGEPAVSVLVDALQSSLPETQYVAIRALGWIGPEAMASCPVLERYLSEPEPRLRLAACVALTEIAEAPEKTVPPLLEAARHTDSELRRLAARSLGELRLPFEPATGCLAEMLGDREPPVVAEAALALGKSRIRTPEVLAALEKTLSHADPLVRQQTLIALASWGPEARAARSAVEVLRADLLENVANLAALAVEKITK